MKYIIIIGLALIIIYGGWVWFKIYSDNLANQAFIEAEKRQIENPTDEPTYSPETGVKD